MSTETFDTTVPHPARLWNYYLDGKDHFAVDRAAGEAYKKWFPAVVEIARATRAAMTRVLTYLTAEAGVRQFLDVGVGLPTAVNVHDVAQRIAPESRVVYVDDDPLVAVHARALAIPDELYRCGRQRGQGAPGRGEPE
nr:SAM-dependent methyltransferase [Frankia sp. CiP3]